MSQRVQVCYYITGHGLGHATRSMELIRALLQSGKYTVNIVSHVSASFFLNSLQDFGINSIDSETNEVIVTINDRNLDTGAVQQDVFVVDSASTLKKYLEHIHQKRQNLLDTEVSWLKENNIQLVLVDAIPLACQAGALAGINTILVSNFSWDFCFKEMLSVLSTRDVLNKELVAQLEQMISQCECDSSSCSYYLQLPGCTPLPRNFPIEKRIPGPLIARQARNINLRSELSIPSGAKMLLLGFGGYSAEWDMKDTYLPEDWVCFVLGAKEADMPSQRYRALSPTAYVPDLISAADAVLGKLGYGFVSECITAGTALVYVPRVDWPEEQYLEKLLVEDYSAGVRMSKQDFTSGSWAPYLYTAATLKGSWGNRRTTGDATIETVHIIEQLLDI